ncbi:MAG: acyl carrier protein [Lachnospiraceae bacterium]|jgi:acyl carrier protein|nr:acyl carrier protein [Lachnospiraceae bacterium]MDD4524552.1 acyl carrier protein [Lachnospiraceae bacterium]NLC75648.1 acyl carrier protein [Clostridiales bacterium]
MEFDKLREIIADVLNLDPNEITPESRFAEDFGADSLDLYQIKLEIEDAFDKTIDDEKVANVKTVQDVLNIISSEQNKA